MNRNQTEQWHSIMSANHTVFVPFPEVTVFEEEYIHSVADELAEQFYFNLLNNEGC
jgi:hypothetical protein